MQFCANKKEKKTAIAFQPLCNGQAGVEDKRWEGPEEYDEGADDDALLVLVQDAHADKGDWETEQAREYGDLLEDSHLEDSRLVLLLELGVEEDED